VNVCGHCPRQWTGLLEAHCSACHRHFSNVSAFDAHWVGDATKTTGVNRRQCVPPEDIPVSKAGNPVLFATERQSGTVYVRWYAKATDDTEAA
jgi:hypothetical protein